MEPFVLEILAWVGRLVAQRIAGHALKQAWKRLDRLIQKSLESSGQLAKSDQELAELKQQLQAQREQSDSLLAMASERIAQLEARNQELEAENAALRARVSGRDKAG